MDIAHCPARPAARAVEPMAGRGSCVGAVAAACIALAGCSGQDLPAASTSASQVELAARQAIAGMAWQGPVVTGDFSCRGRHEYAMLGTSASEVAVVVFAAEQAEPIGVLRMPLSGWEPKSIQLSREDLDFAPEDVERDSGAVPPGLVPSRTCLGLAVSDGRAAPTHIYWNRQAKRFATWSR